MKIKLFDNLAAGVIKNNLSERKFAVDEGVSS